MSKKITLEGTYKQRFSKIVEIPDDLYVMCQQHSDGGLLPSDVNTMDSRLEEILWKQDDELDGLDIEIEDWDLEQ